MIGGQEAKLRDTHCVSMLLNIIPLTLESMAAHRTPWLKSAEIWLKVSVPLH